MQGEVKAIRHFSTWGIMIDKTILLPNNMRESEIALMVQRPVR